jgi:membrane protein DedA with SNARE-associated domain
MRPLPYPQLMVPSASVTDSLVNAATSVVGDLGLAGVFVLMVAESACIPIPSEATMPLAGFNVASGHHWSLAVVVIVGVVGNLVGSWIAYAVGYFGRVELLERYGAKIHIKPSHIAAADRWFERRGEITVLLARLLPIVRTFISLPAGVARMNFWRFTLFTAIGCIPWVLALAAAGDALGHNWKKVHHYFQYVDYVVLALIVAAVAYWVYRRIRRRPEDERAAAAETI